MVRCAFGLGLGSFGGLTSAAALPPIRHVFVIVLESQSCAISFGKNSPAPYLVQTLPKEGALQTNYCGIGRASLDNYIAMISAQPLAAIERLEQAMNLLSLYDRYQAALSKKRLNGRTGRLAQAPFDKWMLSDGGL